MNGLADDSPLVSVVIPLFNRATAVQKAIVSALGQLGVHLEVVVVDDGSTDRPQDVISDLADPRIRLIRQRNAGGGAARNRGIAEARGTFLAFLDSDDSFMPGHLDRSLQFLREHTAAAVYSPVLMKREDGIVFQKPPRSIKPNEPVSIYLMCGGGFIPPSTLVVRREDAIRTKFNETIWFGQDTDFAVRLNLNGVRFHMLSTPGSVIDDSFDPSRLSIAKNLRATTEWLEEIRPMIPKRAYRAYLGSQIARFVAKDNKPKGIMMSMRAILTGSFAPRRAVAVFIQVSLGDRRYRALTRWIVASPLLRSISGLPV